MDPTQRSITNGKTMVEVAGAEKPMREMAERLDGQKNGTSI